MNQDLNKIKNIVKSCFDRGEYERAKLILLGKGESRLDGECLFYLGSAFAHMAKFREAERIFKKL